MENQHTKPRPVPQDGEEPQDKWLDSLELVLESLLRDQQPARLPLIFERLKARLRAAGMRVPESVTTPYLNTISAQDEPAYPGDREIERRIKSYIRWNAMAMVVNANRLHRRARRTYLHLCLVGNAL